MKEWRLHCNQCLSDRFNAGDRTGRFNIPPDFIEPISEKMIFSCTCRLDHITYYFYENMKYEILYERGIHAFKDGYYREAVTNFYGAYERFNEFIILLLCNIQSKEQLKDHWDKLKDLKVSSEREYGAFITMFYTKYKTLPKPLENRTKIKMKTKEDPKSPVKFRNSIIHQGYLPTEEQALNFAKTIAEYIKDVFDIVNKDGKEQTESLFNLIIDYYTADILSTANPYDVTVLENGSLVHYTSYPLYPATTFDSFFDSCMKSEKYPDSVSITFPPSQQ